MDFRFFDEVVRSEAEGTSQVTLHVLKKNSTLFYLLLVKLNLYIPGAMAKIKVSIGTCSSHTIT